MDALTYHSRPALKRPVLIAAFRGFNDHAQTGTGAAEYLRELWGATPVASIDPEEFYDFTVVRPTVVLADGRTREIRWPANELAAAQLSGQDRDALILTGIEPSMRWRRFCEAILEVAKSTEVETVVTLGAFPAAVPHSRPIRVRATASSPDVAEQFGLNVSRYQGPTGLVGVLTDQFRQQGLPTISLWAWMPHYVTAGPSPKGGVALLQHLDTLTGLSIDTTGLERQIPEFESRVEDAVVSDPEAAAYVRMLAVVSDPEAAAYVRMLEQQLDERNAQNERSTAQDLPSGDELAAEFERFLRDQRGD